MSDNPRVQAIFYQPPSEVAVECVIIELAGGPKRYARIWADQPKGLEIEYGWVLNESAVKIYEA